MIVAAVVLIGACEDNGTSSSQAADCGFPKDVACRPAAARVDRGTPTFSKPTEITNPLFPVSALDRVIQLGTEEDKPARIEVTRLPGTRVIDWNGMEIETVRSQFVAYIGGRVVETAVDHFAQDDDGAVWYLGEDVNNYENGVLADHEGSWMADKNGRAAMIMPAHPKTGDVYRPENIPDLVFEEDTVKETDMTVAGPRGPVTGAIRVEEHLMDDSLEYKVYAPGYGEFDIRAPDEHQTVALALPVDAAGTPAPSELDTIIEGITAVAAEAGAGDWASAAANMARVSAAWDQLQAAGVPPLLAERLSATLTALGAAVEGQNPGAVAQAVIDTSHAALDVALRYQAPAEVDRARMALWARQASLDAGARRLGAVAGDVVVLDAIRDRSGVGSDPASGVGAALGALRKAVGAKRTVEVGAAAQALEEALTAR